MFSTVFIDISLIFAQLGLENFRKTVRDPPFITFARVLHAGNCAGVKVPLHSHIRIVVFEYILRSNFSRHTWGWFWLELHEIEKIWLWSQATSRDSCPYLSRVDMTVYLISTIASSLSKCCWYAPWLWELAGFKTPLTASSRMEQIWEEDLFLKLVGSEVSLLLYSYFNNIVNDWM